MWRRWFSEGPFGEQADGLGHGGLERATMGRVRSPVGGDSLAQHEEFGLDGRGAMRETDVCTAQRPAHGIGGDDMRKR